MVGSIRSPLFVPANRQDRFIKAAATETDAVILDLEDAVPAEEKERARASLCCTFTEKPVLVRINAVRTPWYKGDVEALQDLPVSSLILSKAEDPAEITSLWKKLECRVPVIALIETAQGLANVRAIVALDGVARLALGSIDLCADLGCAHQRDVLLPVRFELVLASRLAGIAAPIDGVTAQINNPVAIREDALHAKDMGMTGKLCIHPKQITEVRRAFAPSDTELEWAKRVLLSGSGAVSIDGEMVDEPVRIRARSILAAAQETSS
ncbi:MAG: CoA ester lyase [Roseibium sp.]|uniref:HpcH/HpaI aldolase/citrate lyase family protein n=1 Tax=Roseibium sp. TaxID=1936156 RepID=UPI00262D7174|nr:CoA ester lyase [Roseibium sp.]MCV0428516.1 CoA ester lyase [Roseibium sp.]